MADGAAANFVLAVVSICLEAATVLVFIPQKHRQLFLETGARLAGQSLGARENPCFAGLCESVQNRGMEAGGIEPPSCGILDKASTCVFR